MKINYLFSYKIYAYQKLIIYFLFAFILNQMKNNKQMWVKVIRVEKLYFYNTVYLI